jgi:hydroxyacylglutathione hydrolase
LAFSVSTRNVNNECNLVNVLVLRQVQVDYKLNRKYTFNMVEQIAVGGFDKNFAYIIHDGEFAAVVDPSGNVEKIFSVIGGKTLTPVSIFVTHSHFDHIDGIDAFREEYPVPVYMHKNAKGRVSVHEDITHLLKNGDFIDVGKVSVEVFYTPGHTDDAVCYYIKKEGCLISGDTLFVEGCGRVGNEEDAEILYESLQRLKKLPDNTKVYPGHDYGSKPHSTIAHEKKNNRFFIANDFDEFKEERL